MTYLVDNQLPPALARALVAAGFESLHILDVDLAQAADHGIWLEAAEREWIVISKDEDFFHLANRPGDTGRLLWLRSGNTRKKVLLAHVLPNMIEVAALFSAGQRIVELRF